MSSNELKTKLNAVLTPVRDMCAEAEKDGRDFTPEERNQIEGWLKEAGEIKGQIQKAEAEESLRKRIADITGESEIVPPTQRGIVAPAGRGKSIGERFIQAEAFRQWMKQVAPNGAIPEGMKGIMSPPVEFKELFKDLVTGGSDVSAGAFVPIDYTGIYEPLGRRPTTLLDLIPRGTTQSDIVEYVRQTTQITQAAPVAEANVTDYTGATGEISGTKPEAAIAYEKVTATVKTIAAWIPATKRALSDAGQLRTLIDMELRDDLREELEDQIYDGDGIGENFTGILNTAGILTQAWDTDILTTCRKAKTAVMTTGRARPTSWVFNPADWETIELLKDGNDRFYGGGPFAATPANLWGVPVVESECVNEGIALLADWRKCRIWDREQATISVSDSHADFFIRNMVAILAELRAAFGIIRPSAFIQVDLSAGS